MSLNRCKAGLCPTNTSNSWVQTVWDSYTQGFRGT